MDCSDSPSDGGESSTPAPEVVLLGSGRETQKTVGSNAAAQTIVFPDDLPEAVRQAIREWQVPDPKYQRCEIPPNLDRSIIFNWGVRYEEIENGNNGNDGGKKAKKPMAQLWQCLASESCRSKRTTLKIASNTTTGATQHLFGNTQEDEHQITQNRGNIPKEFQRPMTGVSTCDFWRENGDGVPPHLKRVAQAVLGAPASATVMERDFCVARQLLSRQRASLGPANVESILFLIGAYAHIPKDIPKLTPEQGEKAVPERFRDINQLNELRVLEPFSSDDEVGEEDDPVESDSDAHGIKRIEDRETIPDIGNEPKKGKRQAKDTGSAGGGGAAGGEKTREDEKMPYVDPNGTMPSSLIQGTHTCPECSGFMHAFCGTGVGDEGFGQAQICGNCEERASRS